MYTEYDISVKKYDFQTLCKEILGNTEEYEISVDENIGIYTAEKENGGQLRLEMDQLIIIKIL